MEAIVFIIMILIFSIGTAIGMYVQHKVSKEENDKLKSNMKHWQEKYENDDYEAY